MSEGSIENGWQAVHYPLHDTDPLPPERKVVLVWLGGDNHLPFCGYVRYAAGSDSPYFVVYHGNPKIGADVVAWCDCLPDVGPDVPTATMYSEEQITGRGFPARAALADAEKGTVRAECARLRTANAKLVEACRATLALGFHGHFSDPSYIEKHIEPVVAKIHEALAAHKKGQ